MKAIWIVALAALAPSDSLIGQAVLLALGSLRAKRPRLIGAAQYEFYTGWCGTREQIAPRNPIRYGLSGFGPEELNLPVWWQLQVHPQFLSQS